MPRVLTEFQNVPAVPRRRTASSTRTPHARSWRRSTSPKQRVLRRTPATQLLINQLQQGIGGSYFLTRAEQQRLFNLENEEREVQYAQFAADKFAGSRADRRSRDQGLLRQERRSLHDHRIGGARVRRAAPRDSSRTQVAPTEADLQKLYDDNRANYVLDEHRRARHIVIPVTGDDDAGALKQAESVAAEARTGKDFAELAKKYSSDTHGERGWRPRASCRRKTFPVRSATRCSRMKVGDVAGAGEVAVRLSHPQARGDRGG